MFYILTSSVLFFEHPEHVLRNIFFASKTPNKFVGADALSPSQQQAAQPPTTQVRYVCSKQSTCCGDDVKCVRSKESIYIHTYIYIYIL